MKADCGISTLPNWRIRFCLPSFLKNYRLRVTFFWLRCSFLRAIYFAHQMRPKLDSVMPKKALLLQLFVASPADVTAEREQLEILVEEMNKTWGRSLGVICELLRWETDVRPAFGVEPQAVINAQIGDEYDIFIGILWSRFGTRTSRAESGTIEEFERAYARMLTEGKPEIMIYFKDAPISPSKLDPDDLKKIQIFKQSIGDKGGIYGTFSDMDNFSSLLRLHLYQAVQKLITHQDDNSGQPHPQVLLSENPMPEPEDELGYLDFMEQFESTVPTLLATMEEIGAATDKIGKDIADRTKEMNNVQTGQSDPKSVRRSIKLAGDDMQTYAATLEGKVVSLAKYHKIVFGALSNALAIRSDFHTDDEELTTLAATLMELLRNLQESQQHVTEFRRTVHGLPRITTEINRAKRAVVMQLDFLMVELEGMLQVLFNIHGTVKRMLNKGQL